MRRKFGAELLEIYAMARDVKAAGVNRKKLTDQFLDFLSEGRPVFGPEYRTGNAFTSHCEWCEAIAASDVVAVAMDETFDGVKEMSPRAALCVDCEKASARCVGCQHLYVSDETSDLCEDCLFVGALEKRGALN